MYKRQVAHLVDAERSIDIALSKFTNTVGSGYLGELREYKKLVRLRISLTEARCKIEKRTAQSSSSKFMNAYIQRKTP